MFELSRSHHLSFTFIEPNSWFFSLKKVNSMIIDHRNRRWWSENFSYDWLLLFFNIELIWTLGPEKIFIINRTQGQWKWCCSSKTINSTGIIWTFFFHWILHEQEQSRNLLLIKIRKIIELEDNWIKNASTVKLICPHQYSFKTVWFSIWNWIRIPFTDALISMQSRIIDRKHSKTNWFGWKKNIFALEILWINFFNGWECFQESTGFNCLP